MLSLAEVRMAGVVVGGRINLVESSVGSSMLTLGLVPVGWGTTGRMGYTRLSTG